MSTPFPGDLLADATARATTYLAGRDQRPVAVSAGAIAALDAFDTPLPPGPVEPATILAQLDELGSPATTVTTGGRFFGFVVGGAVPAALAATWLAAAWDQDAGMAAMCPVNAMLEEVSRRWLLELLGLPPDAGAGFVTGGTMANVTALAAARGTVLRQSGWDVDADGLFGAPPITVVLSEEAHISVEKALSLLGLGRRRVVQVPVDAQGRMRPDQLPALTTPAIVCTQAGNVNTGASDPFVPIIDWARAAGAWVHVDGAFGLWAAVAPDRAGQVAGVEAADSWAIDAHKWLNVPYDSGVAIVREAADLRAAMAASASYLVATGQREPDQHTPELSRRARGVEVWAALASLGREGVADLVERCCRHAALFAAGLRAAGYDVLNDVTLNQILVSFGTDAQTRAVIAGIQADGTCWCGGTVWQGRAAMRISVSSWATTTDDVAISLEKMLAIAREVAGAPGAA